MLHYAGVCTDGKEKVQEVAWGNAKVIFFYKKPNYLKCNVIMCLGVSYVTR